MVRSITAPVSKQLEYTVFSIGIKCALKGGITTTHVYSCMDDVAEADDSLTSVANGNKN